MKATTRDELAAKLGSPGLVVVNVLAREGYDKIHIRGSISIPRNELEKGRWRELEGAEELVVYCSSYSCAASHVAADFLEAKGFHVWAYEGGVREWAEAGLPTEGRLSAKEFLEERYGRAPPQT